MVMTHTHARDQGQRSVGQSQPHDAYLT